MRVKYKFIGILIILMGIFPLIMNVKPIADSFLKYPLLSYLTPGGVVYQFVIILLGILLVWEGRYYRRGYY